MPNYISPISWGLGDLIVSLPAVTALIATGEPTYLVARSDLQLGLEQRIEGLSGIISERDFSQKRLAPDDCYYNMRNHPIQTDYWWGSPEFNSRYPNYKINDILKVICKDLKIDANFEVLKPLKSNRRDDIAGSIVFVPGTDGQYKNWPVDYWITLHQFLSSKGHRVIMIGQPDKAAIVKDLISHGINWIETPDIASALDVISNCSLVVSVDTGLMHLAVHQGIATIALYRNGPIYLRSYKHCHAFIAPDCAKECDERYVSVAATDAHLTDFKPTTWSCAADESERCMTRLKPDGIISMVSAMNLLPGCLNA